MECAAILVANGANVLQADNLGRTCLHLAVLAGLPNIIRFLCTLPQAPVLVQVKDGEGKLPADYLTSDVNLAGYQEASAAVRRVRTLVGLASMVFF
jgi:ankyrin repeat protein